MTPIYTAPLALYIGDASQPAWLSTSLTRVLGAIGVADYGITLDRPPSSVSPVEDPEPIGSLDDALALLSFSGDPSASTPLSVYPPAPPPESVAWPEPDVYTLNVRLAALSEIVIALPGLEGVSLVLNPGGFDAQLIVAGDEISVGFTIGMGIRLAPNLLRPVRSVPAEDGSLRFEEDPSRPYVQIELASASVTIDQTGKIDLGGGIGVQIDEPVMIGTTGVVIESADIEVNLSGTGSRPAGTPAGWKGLLINQASVRVPSVFAGAFTAAGLGIGSGGVSGTISASFNLAFANGGFTGDIAGGVFGMPGGVESVSLTLQQNIPCGGGIRAKLLLPFFEPDQPLDIDIGFLASGALTVAVGSSDGIFTLTRPDLLELQLDSVGFELEDGIFVAKLSGQLTPLFGGLAWPGFKVEELSIDSKGHVRLEGGWLALRQQYELNLYGFKLSITRLGFGKTEDGGKWIGFSGGLKLVDNFAAGASVEGLRITWYDDGRKTRISLNGVGVELLVPDVLALKGAVSFRDLVVNGQPVRRFEGDIKLALLALELEIDAKLVFGTASGPQGSYNFFAIYLGAELPTGIPLGSLPLSLYGIAGLFALQMEPNRKPEQEWYEDWYKLPQPGVTDLVAKWENRRGSLALGGGVTIGTNDNGFTLACKALLVIVFPGPIILLEGKANLLKERAKLDDEPLFRTLSVLDLRQGQVLMGLDARYRQGETDGKLIDIRAGAEAFFHTPQNWHLYLGEREPRDKRIRAEIFKLFEANSYFMLEPGQLATGAWLGYARNWQFGPVGLSLEAWLEGNVVVSWNPVFFHGDLWLHGLVEVSVFGFGMGLGVDARFAADVFDPFHVVAGFEVSVKLPKPLKSKHVEVTLEWGPSSDWPSLPLPFKEITAEHFKVTTTWPLPVPTSGIDPPHPAAPVVPLDVRPHVAFRRPVHDDALVGVNPQPVEPAFERIGDPARDEGPVRVRYGLKEVALLKWDATAQAWRSVAVAGRPLAAGERALFGSWAPAPGTSTAGQSNDKLWLWSRTPFDYTRHGGSEGDDWLTAAFPSYPCIPQELPDREVCCDFDRVDRAQPLASPWQPPGQTEITLRWDERAPNRVTVLDPPADGHIRALCFPPPAPPAATVPDPALVTIALSTPAKQVRVWVLPAQPAAKKCIDFRSRKRTVVQYPLREQGASFGSAGAIGNIFPVATTLGDLGGLSCAPTSQRGAPPIPLEIVLPCAATVVDLVLSVQLAQGTSAPATVAAFSAAGEPVATRRTANPVRQPEMVRFEGLGVKRIRISGAEGMAFLHQLCFTCPEAAAPVTAAGFDPVGHPAGQATVRGGLVELVGEGLSQVRLSGAGPVCLLMVCALFGPDPREAAERAEMAKHLPDEVARWQQAGEVLEPFSAYRLRVLTTVEAEGMGELSGSKSGLEANYADFRTEGPPGLAKLSVPLGQEPAKFESGLDDLTRYVRQTTPPTVPAPGEKPVMVKPVYRAYDVGVEFNEDYVDLMYRLGGRDLGLYLYDANNQPARGADGRLLAQSGEWGAAETLTLTEGEERWLALAEAGNRCLPVLDRSTIVHDRTLASAVARRVLAPDTVYEARLIPLLLRELFAGYTLHAAAQGPAGRLGRWEVRDAGNTGGPSSWEVRETSAPAARYLAQTSAIQGTVLVYGPDPSLPAGHADQPAEWTDVRLSAYVRGGGGAVGLVFRYRGGGDHYRVSLECGAGRRRLAKASAGTFTVLAEDAFACETGRDYLLTVEAVGGALRVYQDGAPVFDVADAAHTQGSVGLYAHDEPAARFADVRVDDFRATARPAYRFPFTTSRFANFFHHLHSYQDECWRVAATTGDVAAALPALAKAVPPATPPGEDEARAYATLAEALLGAAARRNPPEVQVTRVEIDGEPRAFLVQGPEPVDWLRTEIALRRTPFARTDPALPGRVKLTGVRFAGGEARLDRVEVLVRDPLDLAGYRVESRLAAWPLRPDAGAVVDAQALAQDAGAAHAWAAHHTFAPAGTLAAGTVLRLPPDAPPGSDAADAAPLARMDAGSVEPARRILFSVEVRIVAPDGTVAHARHFLPEEDYLPEDVRVLRKADGTGFFMVPTGAVPFAPAQYRLLLKYLRDNRAHVPGSPVWSQAGDTSAEAVALDIPLQTL